jgi:hypothetical protein
MQKNKNNVKKRHHYIPVCYSKNFTSDDNPKCIFVYEKGNANSPELRTPNNIGVIGHYNTFQKANGGKDTNTVEDMYSAVEKIWPDLINKFQKKELLTYEDFHNLCTFIALMRIRVPNFRLQFGSFNGEGYKTTSIVFADTLLAGKKIANVSTNEIKLDELKRFRDDLITGEVKVQISKQIDLKSLEHFKDLHKCFRQLNWSVLASEHNRDFITSDNPLIWYHLNDFNNIIPYKGGLDNPNVQVVFPLTKRLILIGNHIFDHNFGYGLIKQEKVIEKFNELIAISAEQYVYASQGDINFLVQKYKDLAPRMSFKRIPLTDGKSGYIIVCFPTLGNRNVDWISC